MRRTMRLPAKGAAARGALALLALAGCADLSSLEVDECGNRVIEGALGEECDGQTGCGAPGTQGACRYSCDGATGTGCPAGYGCGLDGICRRHQGKFEILGGGSTATTSDLGVGDINGDRCVEMVRATQRGSVITAFDSRAPEHCEAWEQTFATLRPGDPPNAYPAPLVSDLIGDRRLELVIPARGLLDEGLLVFLGGEGTALSPALYPSARVKEPDVKMLTVRLRGVERLLLLLSQPGGGDGSVAIVDELSDKPVMLIDGLPAPLQEIVALQAVDLDGAGVPEDQRCDEVAIGRRGDPRVQIFRLCDAGAFTFAPFMSPEIQLDSSAKLRDTNASLAFAYVNDSDTHLDLVTNADDQKIHVAYGLGDGRFHSSPPGEPPPVSPDQQTSALIFPPSEAFVEEQLVRPESIFVAAEFDPARPGAEIVPLPCPPSEPFASPVCQPILGPCEAVVTDIDADSHLDIVASEGQQPDLTLRRGDGAGGFHVERIETECPPHYLAASDVDGDGLIDLAFIDQVRKNDELPDEEMPQVGVTVIAIAYGNAFAAPALSEERGQLAEALGLVAGRFVPGAGGAQLFAARRYGQTEGALALVEVQGERLLHAPFYFPATMAMGNENLRSVTLRAVATGPLGRPIEGGGRRDILAVHTEDVDPDTKMILGGTARLSLIDSDDGAGLLRTVDEGTAAAPCDQCVLVPMRAGGGDLDVVLMLGAGEIIVYESTMEGLAERDRLASAHTFRSRAASNPPKYVPRPLVDDLDGDGQDDVVARSEEGALIALWGRPDGSFDEAVLAAAPDCGGAAGCGDLAIASLNADPDPAREVVIIGPGRFGLYDIMGRELVEKPKAVLVEGPNDEAVEVPMPPVTDFTALGAGDFDGDGVDDIAIVPASSFFGVLRGIPVVE